MTPVGYMFKKVVARPDWLKVNDVKEIYSVSGHISENFCDFINFWKHNGYWLFNSPESMEQLSKEENIDLSECILFYYEVFEKQFDENSKEWSTFEPEPSFFTHVEKPAKARLEGYDVTTFSACTSPECSPLSCNGLATKISVNNHCLFDTFEQAVQSLEAGKFDNSEPGSFRIFAVYTVGS